MKLIEKAGVSREDASRAVYLNNPRFKALRANGMAPDNIMAEDNELRALEKQVINIAKNGIPGQTGPMSVKEAQDYVLANNPRAAEIIAKRNAPNTVVVPQKGVSSSQKEEEKARKEAEGHIATIDDAITRIKDITKGTIIGNIKSGLPPWIPTAGESRKNANIRDDWNTQVQIMVGAAYKLGTDATEPKRLETITKYSKPYIIDPDDNEDTARNKMELLKGLVSRNAGAKGVAIVPSSSPFPGSAPDVPNAGDIAKKMGLAEKGSYQPKPKPPEGLTYTEPKPINPSELPVGQ